MYAASAGHKDVLENVLQAGANMTATGHDALNSLYWAAVENHKGAVRAFLDGQDIDVNALVACQASNLSFILTYQAKARSLRHLSEEGEDSVDEFETIDDAAPRNIKAQ